MISHDYLSQDVVNKIKEQFKLNNKMPSVTLQSFFDKKAYLEMKKEISKLKFPSLFMSLFQSVQLLLFGSTACIFTSG